MFQRERHRLIASVLAAMDGDVLRQTQCFFGGGTAISMQLGEYRQSVVIDFLIHDEDGYRWLRNSVSEQSLGALFRQGQAPKLASGGVRKDRYGIRAVLDAGGTPVKFEIVSENRIALRGQRIGMIPVPVVDREGLFAEKLLANADRWAASESFSRDAIDLAHMMDAWGTVPNASLDAARRAYGASVDDALRKAAGRLADQQWRARCCAAMTMDVAAAGPVVGRFVSAFAH